MRVSLGTHSRHTFHNVECSGIVLYAEVCKHPMAAATLSVANPLVSVAKSPSPAALMLLLQYEQCDKFELYKQFFVHP